MPDTYFYTVLTETGSGGTWQKVNGKSVKAGLDTHIRYTVKVYKNIEDGAHQLDNTNPLHGYTDPDSVKVEVVRATDSADYVGEHVSIHHYTDGGGHNVTLFRSEFKATSNTGSFHPNFTVSRWPSGGPAYLIVPIKTGNVVASITFTAAAVTPQFPKQNADGSLTDLYNKVNGVFTTDNLKWDEKTQRWVLLVHTNAGAKGWLVQIFNYTKAGKEASHTAAKYDKTSNGTNYKAAQKELLQAVQDSLQPDAPSTGSQPASPDTFKGGFNPPNHFFTRRPSFTEVVNVTGNANLAGQISKHHTLGRIVQDKNSSKILNLKMGTNPAPKDGFGFRFSYNPTTISYATTANAPIDWTLGTSDTANVLGGPTMVSFDLYLNRIADVAALASGLYQDSNYVKALDDEQKKGLKTRGTEYDLEFLYRVVNGTPLNTDLTIDKQLTSDFGYITGVPFWLYFNDNLRYFGGLSNLSVNHLMFSTDMVPIFTVVSITFNRYPVFDSTGYIGKKQGEAYQASQASKTTGVTTPPG